MSQPLLDAAAEPGHSAPAYAVADRSRRLLYGQNVAFCDAAKSKEQPLLKGQWQSSALLCIGAADKQGSGPGTTRVPQK
jgi:hypothetical protein